MGEPLDTNAAAVRIGLSVSTLRKMRITGRGPKFVKMGKAVRYRAADIEAWMGAHVVGSTSEKVAA